MLEAIGYWFNERAPSAYPRPQRLVGAWEPDERAAVLAYLRAGDELEDYRGRSYCRFDCGERQMGHRDLTDGRFAWPEGLAHYVEVHAVRLPDPFVAHVVGGPGKRAVRVRRIDDGPWIAWGRAQGAMVAGLDGWAPLSWEDQRKVLTRLHAQLGPEHPLGAAHVDVLLGRRPTDQLLLGLDDGRLALVTLTGAATRFFSGWDDWPGDTG